MKEKDASRPYRSPLAAARLRKKNTKALYPVFQVKLKKN